MYDRVSRTTSGTYQLRLRPNETALLRDLIAQLRDQLTASTDAPAVRRLFPPAYANDPERDAGYQVLTRDDLLDSKLQALATVEAILDAGSGGGGEEGGTEVEVDQTQLTAWMQALNNLRLVLGTILDVDEEMPPPDPDDPQTPVFAVYEFLGWLLDQTVNALEHDLPED